MRNQTRWKKREKLKVKEEEGKLLAVIQAYAFPSFDRPEMMAKSKKGQKIAMETKFLHYE